MRAFPPTMLRPSPNRITAGVATSPPGPTGSGDGVTDAPRRARARGAVGHGRRARGRFASFGATLEPDVAGRLLAQLAELGLVRAARQDGTATAPRARRPSAHGGSRGGPGGDAAVSLAELEALRTDLLSTIAHELRTPLTAVRTSVGLLLDPTARADRCAAGRPARVDRAQRRAHAAARRRHPRPLPVPCRERRAPAPAVPRDRARRGGDRRGGAARHAPDQTITLSRAAEDIHVFGDRRRLEQALINLVSNAHRYAPDGSEIGVRVMRRGHDTAWAVTDHGPGIPEEDQAACSSASSSADRIGRPARRASGWGCRPRSRSRRRTAARSRWPAASERGARSPSWSRRRGQEDEP